MKKKTTTQNRYLIYMAEAKSSYHMIQIIIIMIQIWLEVKQQWVEEFVDQIRMLIGMKEVETNIQIFKNQNQQ